MGRFLIPDPLFDFINSPHQLIAGDDNAIEKTSSSSNAYAISNNNTIVLLDPLGLFSLEVHENITRSGCNFAGICEKCCDLIVEGNLYVDTGISFGVGSNLFPWLYHQHFMYVPSLGQNANDAYKNAVKYIVDRWADAENAAMTGFCEKALFNLGESLHTIQDSYAHSPKQDGITPGTWGNHSMAVDAGKGAKGVAAVAAATIATNGVLSTFAPKLGCCCGFLNSGQPQGTPNICTRR
jgi:hypothetical protein